MEAGRRGGGCTTWQRFSSGPCFQQSIYKDTVLLLSGTRRYCADLSEILVVVLLSPFVVFVFVGLCRFTMMPGRLWVLRTHTLSPAEALHACWPL